VEWATKRGRTKYASWEGKKFKDIAVSHAKRGWEIWVDALICYNDGVESMETGTPVQANQRTGFPLFAIETLHSQCTASKWKWSRFLGSCSRNPMDFVPMSGSSESGLPHSKSMTDQL
jgi:hypothetical protein